MLSLNVDAALAEIEAWEARVVALSHAVRTRPTSPYRRLWAADCKRAVAAWCAQGERVSGDSS